MIESIDDTSFLITVFTFADAIVKMHMAMNHQFRIVLVKHFDKALIAHVGLIFPIADAEDRCMGK